MIYINSNYYVILSLLNTKHRWNRKKHKYKMKRIKKKQLLYEHEHEHELN